MATAQGLPPDDLAGFETRAEDAARGVVRRIIAAIIRAVREAVSPQAVDPVVVTAPASNMWVAQAPAAVMPVVVDTWTAAAAATAADFAAAGVPTSVLGPDRAAAYITEATNRLVGLGDDIWHDIATQLAAGVDMGETIPELAARIQAVAPVSEARATTIARTEVIAASNAGSFAQAQVLDDPSMTKTWVATNDPRTRPTHRAADGQAVPLLSAFIVGGFPLMVPGDPTGPPEEVINCRCTQIYDFDAGALVAAWDTDVLDLGWSVVMAYPDREVLTADGDEHSGAMIALVPSAYDAARLEVGEPADELHTTLVYLGEDAKLTPEQRQALLAAAENVAGSFPSLHLDGFALAIFNPGSPDRDTCVVLEVSGDEGPELMLMRDMTVKLAADALGVMMPAQHVPYIPHVTLAYTDDPTLAGQLTHLTGPVTFDRLRVAFGGDVFDFPLTLPDEPDMGPWDVTVAAGKFVEAKHKRDAHGQFATMAARLGAALKAHDGNGDPFAGFTREQLRREATKQGITLSRGEGQESISKKLQAKLGGKSEDTTKATPKPAAPETPAAPDGDVPTVKPTASTSGRERGKVQDLQPGDYTSGGRVTKVIDDGGRYIRVNRIMAGHELQDRYERDAEINFFRATPEEIARDKEPREVFAAADDPVFASNSFARPARENVLEDLHQGRITHEEAATRLRDSVEYLREAADRNGEVGNADNETKLNEAADALERLADEVGQRDAPSTPEAPAAPTPDAPSEAQRTSDALEDIYVRAANGEIAGTQARTEAAAHLDGLKLSAPALRDLSKQMGITVQPRATKGAVRDAIVERRVGAPLQARALARDTSVVEARRKPVAALAASEPQAAKAPAAPAAPRAVRQPKPQVEFAGDAPKVAADLKAIRDRGVARDTSDARGEAAAYLDSLKLTAPQMKALARELDVHTPAGARKQDIRDRIVQNQIGAHLAAAAIARAETGKAAADAIERGRVKGKADVPPAPDVSTWHGDLTPGQTQVAAISASPLVGERRQGGAMGLTSLEDREQGRIIRKNVATRPGSADVRDPDEQADAEQLGVLVAEAVGLRPPAVLRTGQHELEMEFIDGETGEQLVPWGEEPARELMNEADDQLMSILDHSINNQDRNPGNWVLTPDGRLSPIDHSMAFYPGETEPYAAVDGPLTLTQTEGAAMRAQIEALRPEFDRVGRGEWLDDTLTRFDELEFAPDPTPEAPAAPARGAVDEKRVAAVQSRLAELEAQVAPLRAWQLEYTQKYRGGRFAPAQVEDELRRQQAETRKLKDEAAPLAAELLDLLRERDGTNLGSADDPDGAHWDQVKQDFESQDFPRWQQSKLSIQPAPGVTPAQTAAATKVIDKYREDDRTTVLNNEKLRADDPSVKAWERKVQAAVETTHLSQDSIVYRGAALPPQVLMQFRPGAVISDKGFNSTTSDREIAEGYITTRSIYTPGVLPVAMEIRTKAGTPVADAQYDGEIVFGAGRSMRIISVSERPAEKYVPAGIYVVAEWV